MADEATQSQSPPPNRARRSSFAGQTFADLFSSSNRPSYPRGGSYETNSPPPSTAQQQQQMPGPIQAAAAQANRRRLSVSTLGLSGSPGQTSPFGSLRGHRDSMSSSGNSASIDESAIEDEGPGRDPNNTPASPFARRSSFGAKALRDRMGSFSGGGGGGGSPPASNGRSPPPAKSSGSNGTNGTISSRGEPKGRGSSGEGFNWSENFRSRAERTSVAGPGAGGGNPFAGGGGSGGAGAHSRATSVAVMEAPPAAQLPKPKEKPRPDHFQERILKGDFYMD